MNPALGAFSVAPHQIGRVASAVRFDGEHIDQSGCRRASDARRKRAPIVVTRTTDLRFNFTQRALDQTFRRNPGIFDDAGDQLRRRQHRLVVAIGRTFAVYPALGACVACAFRSAAASAGVNGNLLTELSVLGCESIV